MGVHAFTIYIYPLFVILVYMHSLSVSIHYMLFAHMDADVVSKSYYLHMRIWLITTSTCLPFMYNIFYIFLYINKFIKMTLF